jgi:cytosine/creatinine deaminase
VLITNAALRGRSGTWDLSFEGGVFRSVVPRSVDSSGSDGRADGEVIDAAGRLVVEPFVDAHMHLESGPRWPSAGPPSPTPSTPWGRGTLLRILDAGPHVRQMLTADQLGRALDFITVNGARNLGIGDR